MWAWHKLRRYWAAKLPKLWNAVKWQIAVTKSAMRCAGFQVEGSKRGCTAQPEASASSTTANTEMACKDNCAMSS